MNQVEIEKLDVYDPLTRTQYSRIHEERLRAHHKHDDNEESMERRYWDDASWTDVVNEEWGEVSRVRNEYRHGNLSKEEALREMHKELIQTAAMVMAWADAVQRVTGVEL